METIPQLLKAAWEHAYPGREAAERNAVLRVARLLVVDEGRGSARAAGLTSPPQSSLRGGTRVPTAEDPMTRPMLQRATFIAPCLPSPARTTAKRPRLGARDQARRLPADGSPERRRCPPARPQRPRLDRPLPAHCPAVDALAVTSCLIDGEAVACNDGGLAVFERLRGRRHEAGVFLYAFDLIELNGTDLRHEPLQFRKATLASVLVKAGPGIRFNEHLECDDRETVFRHACKLGLEGIVSKRKDSRYVSGRSQDWLKIEESRSAAVKREAEEDWAKKRGHRELWGDQKKRVIVMCQQPKGRAQG